MSCLWDRTKKCGDLRFYLFENVVFVKSVAPITRLSYIPCLLIYITLCLDVTLDSARCSSLTRALLRLERTMNLLEGGKGGEGRMGERGWGGDGGRVGREGGEGTWGREGGWGEREGEEERGRVGREGG